MTIKQFKKLMKELLNRFEFMFKKFRPLKPKSDLTKEGLKLSQLACQQQENVNMTPWMKNLLVSLNDIKSGDRLTAKRAPYVKALDYLKSEVRNFLHSTFGSDQLDYDYSMSILDINHFKVDNFRALKDWDTKFWDIQLKQADKRAKTLKSYQKPTLYSPKFFSDLIDKDEKFLQALYNVYTCLPECKASRTYYDVEMDFSNKHSNTSYPWFRRDNLPKEKGLTWGKYALEYTKRITNNGNNPDKILNYNVFTAWPRNQMGKGRAIEASSRVVNIELYRLARDEIQKYKTLFQFSSLLKPEDLKKSMCKLVQTAEKLNLTMSNSDQSAFDTHQSVGMIAVIWALRKLKLNDTLSLKLNDLRALIQSKTYLIDGPNNMVTLAYGRTFSGYIDTMTFNTLVSWVLDEYNRLTVGTDTKGETNLGMYLGDDILSAHPQGDSILHSFETNMNKLGYEMNKSKNAAGAFFLQYRLFKHPKKKDLIMSYSLPRVIRSALSKEDSKGLGPVGWTIALWMQLYKLIEWEEGLRFALNLFMKLDNTKDPLLLKTDIKLIKKSLAKEDQESKVKNSKRFEDTASKLYNGNPQMNEFFILNNTNSSSTRDGAFDLNEDFLSKLQKKFKDVIRLK